MTQHDDFGDILGAVDSEPPAVGPDPRVPKAWGRPVGGSVYRPEFAEQARRLCERMGATDNDLAYFFGVTRQTIERWRVAHEAFGAALTVGKEVADERVARSFYTRAVGFWVETEKIFMPAGATEPVRAKTREYYPPDVAAATFWLRNRRPDEWKERKEVGVGGAKPGSPLTIHAVPESLTDADIAFLGLMG